VTTSSLRGQLAAAQLPKADVRRLSLAQSLLRAAPHLLALGLPLNSLAFVLTGPHRWWLALLFTVPVFASGVIDAYSGITTRPGASGAAKWPFDLLLLVLTALQLVNLVLLAHMLSRSALLSVDTIAAAIAVGSSSAHSGIVVAHELIHRPGKLWQSLGRLLLAGVLYEHFFTEHVRGHHVRVGTPEDPATARFGESFERFYVRTVPAQFKSAWRLETARLGDPDMRWYDPQILRSRVLHGIVLELSTSAAIGYAFGAASLIAHVLQALWASRGLEMVNYFEHWGLERRERRVLPTHSWDTYSRFTYYTLTGLSRHADHHAVASRPYQQLGVTDSSPKLPTGYVAMMFLVLGRNRRFQELMTAELQRRKLGPFAPAEHDQRPSESVSVTMSGDVQRL
jgi:alkane 1-monooxygenase